MKKQYSEAEALSRLMELCAQSEKSAYEIKQKLKQWNLESKSDDFIEKLKAENFINESRFVKAFSHDKILINKWGKIKIKYMLRGHQINENIINDGLSEIDEKEYTKMLGEEMHKKNKSLKISNRYQRKAKLYAFGSQRGYESELLNQFFDKEGL